MSESTLYNITFWSLEVSTFFYGLRIFYNMMESGAYEKEICYSFLDSFTRLSTFSISYFGISQELLLDIRFRILRFIPMLQKCQ